ncbi:MAG: hypothetical protein ACC628_06315 [Pirellulaceae bacterium]
MADKNRTQRTLLKGFAFRFAAVMLALSPFVAAEIVLRWADWGSVTETVDPYLGFGQVHPLFELNTNANRFETSEKRLAFFCRDSFAAEKARNEYRIFCLGGSTVQGRPYAIETSFTTWLELSLQAADARRRWEVVNCGGVSYASYRLINILREVLHYDPDLVIVYTGHNEFLEDRSYQNVKQTPRLVATMHGWLSHSHFYNVCRAGWLHLRGARIGETKPPATQLPAEVDAVLDYRDGLRWYGRDDDWQRDVVEHFQFSLERMVRVAETAGVPFVFVNPVSNLKDCPPFKAENRGDLSPRVLAEFDTLWGRAKSLDAEQEVQRLAYVQAAIAIDHRHAGAHFLKGHCLLAQRRFAEAKESFLHAKDEDLCPLRMIEPLHAAIRRVASRHGTPWVDVRQLFEEHTADGIPGKELMLDHVHPRISGHQMVASALLDEMVKLGIIVPQAGWQNVRARLYQKHLATLDTPYYARGMERLKGLQKWTQGKAPKVRREKGDAALFR